MAATRLLLCVAVFLSVLTAQSDRGTITGRVTDASFSGVPNSKVTAVHLATGVRYGATTSETGRYTLLQLPVGRYAVSVEAPGFRRFLRQNVDINVAQSVALDVDLELGQVDQTVEVFADASQVQATSSEVGTVITRSQVIDLPLAIAGNMRNPEAFVFLTPGVTGDAANTQINGSQSRAKEVLLDGVGATLAESGGTLFTYPSVESLSEFKLVSSTFTAEYGRTGGGFEVFTTKSGTNAYHGSVFDYLRNDVFDGRGFFSRTTAVNRQNEFGASAGGPLIRNKTFFHLVYSGFRFRQGATNELVTIPTADFRQGDFSRLTDRNGNLIRIFDPGTTRTENGLLVRSPFAENLIPQSRFSAVARQILPLVPDPTGAGTVNNYLTVGARTFDRDLYTIKMDHSFTARSRISGFLYWGEQKEISAERLPNPLTSGLDRDRASRWARLTHDYTFTAATLNNFIVGFTREGEYWTKLSADQGWPDRIGLAGVNSGAGNTFPRISFTDGFATWGDDSKTVGSQVNNAWQINDTVSHIRGNHSLKLGVEARWLQTNGADFFGSQGQFNFSSLETAQPMQRGTTGNAFASFLLGAVDSGELTLLTVVPGNRYRYLAGFAQDDWRVSRKLTLNIGLRYDLLFPRTERFNNFSGFDPSLPNPGAGGLPGAVAFLGNGAGRNGRTSFADTAWMNLGPRFGFAYAASDRTVIRGGYGIYYAPGNAAAGLRASQSFTFGFNASPRFASTDQGVTPAFDWDAGFPQHFPRPPFIDPTVANGSAVNAILPEDGRPPYIQNWSFGVQRELRGRVLADLAYVGNKGTRLGNGLYNLNQVDPRYLSLGPLLSAQVDSAQARAAGIEAPYAGFRGSVAQALRPYPQYLAITNRSNPSGNSTYHALQAKIEKRYSSGLTALAAYTWSKSLSDNDIQAGGGPGGQDFYNRAIEKSLSPNDVPHSVAVSYMYELPFGAGKAFLNGRLWNRFAGGWTVTGIHQYSSGKPIQLTANNTLPLFNGLLRPDVEPDVERTIDYEAFDPMIQRVINPAAFSIPSLFRFGTAARSYSDLRAAPYYNESFGAIKRTPLTERVTLTFRAEFFNVLNRVVFAAPAANVSDATFGRISAQANTPRQGQVALRVDF